MLGIVEIDYSIFDSIKMLTGIELMIIITLFMGLAPVFNRMRAIEVKINDIQFNLGKMIADLENISHTYNYRDLKSAVEKNNNALTDVIGFLYKNHGFKVKENNQIKYLDYDP